jgi:hypothetical protein
MPRAKALLILAAALIIPISQPMSLAADGRNQSAGQILDELGSKAFRWFEANRNPKTGLVRDRGPNWPGEPSGGSMASIASMGYYLSMLPEAERLGQIKRETARPQALQMLRFVKSSLQHHDGLFYHFIDWDTGQRYGKCEVSVLDSAIFFNGCIVVAQAYGAEVAELANFLLDRAAWDRFVIVEPHLRKKLLALGWSPEAGLFGNAGWRTSEMAMPYFLAVGSRTNPIEAQCWYNTPANRMNVVGYNVLFGDQALFTSYYGLGWHDLRGKVDKSGVNLEANARIAALANRAACSALARQSRLYAKAGGIWWGISAGDAPAGYIAPGPLSKDLEGTLWPMAALAALPWIPNEIEQDIVRWRASALWPRISGEYGLSPFNFDKSWVGKDLIGIDLGSFYINLANYRNQTVWKLWMQHPIAQNALQRLGFKTASAR